MLLPLSRTGHQLLAGHAAATPGDICLTLGIQEVVTYKESRAGPLPT